MVNIPIQSLEELEFSLGSWADAVNEIAVPVTPIPNDKARSVLVDASAGQHTLRGMDSWLSIRPKGTRSPSTCLHCPERFTNAGGLIHGQAVPLR